MILLQIDHDYLVSFINTFSNVYVYKFNRFTVTAKKGKNPKL